MCLEIGEIFASEPQKQSSFYWLIDISTLLDESIIIKDSNPNSLFFLSININKKNLPLRSTSHTSMR